MGPKDSRMYARISLFLIVGSGGDSVRVLNRGSVFAGLMILNILRSISADAYTHVSPTILINDI